jgi:hypothetical protein
MIAHDLNRLYRLGPIDDKEQSVRIKRYDSLAIISGSIAATAVVYLVRTGWKGGIDVFLKLIYISLLFLYSYLAFVALGRRVEWKDRPEKIPRMRFAIALFVLGLVVIVSLGFVIFK